jgi:uncharacterized protein (DUF3084 family)
LIALKKLEEPDSLKRNKEKWTKELLEAIKTGDKKLINNKKKKYNQNDVKAQLKKETHGKCAYCESRVTVVAHGDIEHVTPKSIVPEQTFNWENLTFACQICNQNKSAKVGIFDPYNDPLNEFAFLAAPFIAGKSVRSKTTIIELDLNRPDLIEDRTAHIEVFSRALEAIENEADEGLKDLLLTNLERDLDHGPVEYIAMKRALIAAYK